MKFNMMHPADQIVTIMDRIYNYGMTTTSGGNLSIRDENGDVWISPSGVDKGTLRREDIVCVKPDGTIIGIHKPSVELPFHLDAYKIRPDVNAVLHAHPPALVSFSIVRKIPNTNIIPNASLICGEIQIAPYAVPGSAKLGENIANVFKKGVNVVMMENHGVVIAGKDLFSAFMSFETLDFCARLEINAARLGTPKPLSDKYIEISNRKMTQSLKNSTMLFTHQPKKKRARKCVRLFAVLTTKCCLQARKEPSRNALTKTVLSSRRTIKTENICNRKTLCSSKTAKLKRANSPVVRCCFTKKCMTRTPMLTQ